MDKGQMSSSSNVPSATGPLPSAPPSYEEAVGLPAVPTIAGPSSVSGVPPYPIMVTPTSMPIPWQSEDLTMGISRVPKSPTDLSDLKNITHTQQSQPITHFTDPMDLSQFAPHVRLSQPSQPPTHFSNTESMARILPPQPQDVRVTHVTLSLGPNPVKMSCPTCRADIKSTTMSDHQPSAHVCCIVLCLAGCCLCSCLPYCLSAFLSVHHFCPNCKAYIGTWKG